MTVLREGLPRGLTIGGGSDWIGLDRDFVEYVINSEGNVIIDEMKRIWSKALLPAESFFHTVRL